MRDPPHENRFVPAIGARQFRTTPVGHEILYAFDAASGKPLYSGRKLLPSWVHFSQPVVSNGKIFVVSYDAHVYAFGLK
jgi:hypothetical protein